MFIGISISNPNAVTKKFWSYVKSNSNSSRIPVQVHRNSIHANNDQKRAELFNAYFYDQFSESSTYQTDIDFLSGTLFEIDFNTYSIMNMLKSIDINKSSGPDGIEGVVLKNCALALSYPLSILFRICYVSGQLPTDWKMANVVPIHKKGDKSDVENYRPISLAFLVMKLMEKIVRDEIFDKCRSLISDKQHGFVPSRSCVTQLIPVIDDVASTLNAQNDIDVIYFDFAKAFDSVSHDKILEKLKIQFNINGFMLNFIKGYLQDRGQSFVINGTFSRPLPVKSGVPQGSILGPLLFVLFINDIYQQVSEGKSIALYADDTKIWRTIFSENDCIVLNKDIDSLHKWALINGMNFNPNKCKAISVTLRRPNYYILPFDRFSYELGDCVLDYVTEEKDHGVIIANKLNWEPQQKAIIAKASRQLGLLIRTCYFINNQTQKRSLYITLVRSVFEHCRELW